ncbi:major facilitator superfamily transporter [Colletotrichum salicis]|uniref:Major facilitator superfamily transporter n=1 Tax=Colletotrichum salicis TaxID=1209931 RepID=A0A135U105_9PEZI|nr:major facilitator superfamily transporter [Colletotrichum salicis]
MSLPHEKSPKSVSVIGESKNEAHDAVKEPQQADAERAAYVESKSTWKSFFWSTLDVPKDEARFLTKLDLTLISASTLGVMCRYLDQVNYHECFHLRLRANTVKPTSHSSTSQHFKFQRKQEVLTAFLVNAPLYIAFLEFAWTVFTFATAGVKDVNQLYVFHFFVGLFVAGHFPAVMYMCSSHYKPHELARRNTLIQVFTSVGPLFSGFLMAAVYAGLDGKSGLPGWRWMYMIFTEKEVELARARMPTEVKPHTGLFKWTDVNRWYTTWHVYLFPLFFTFLAQLGQSGGSMIFWVKSYNVAGKPPRFSVAEINIIPLGLTFWPNQHYFHLHNPGQLLGIGELAWSSSMAWYIVCQRDGHYLPHCTGSHTRAPSKHRNSMGLVLHDPEKRAYVSAMMNAFAYIFTAWVAIFTFPANLQPYIVTGNYITAGFGAAAAVTVLVIRYFYNRDLKR